MRVLYYKIHITLRCTRIGLMFDGGNRLFERTKRRDEGRRGLSKFNFFSTYTAAVVLPTVCARLNVVVRVRIGCAVYINIMHPAAVARR